MVSQRKSLYCRPIWSLSLVSLWRGDGTHSCRRRSTSDNVSTHCRSQGGCEGRTSASHHFVYVPSHTETDTPLFNHSWYANWDLFHVTTVVTCSTQLWGRLEIRQGSIKCSSKVKTFRSSIEETGLLFCGLSFHNPWACESEWQPRYLQRCAPGIVKNTPKRNNQHKHAAVEPDHSPPDNIWLTFPAFFCFFLSFFLNFQGEP